MILAEASSTKTILGVLFIVLWIGGGNVLVAWHYHRRGKSIWSGFEPFALPFKDFDRTEWTVFLILMLISVITMIAAVESK